MDLLFCGTGWLSDTSFLLITFYYLGYFEGCFPDFVLTEAKIAKQSCGFGEVTLKLTHPHIGRGGQGHIARGERDIGGEGRQGAASSCDNVLSPSYFVIFFSVLILINVSNFFTSCLMSFFFIPTFEKGCALNGIRIRLVGAI